MGLQYRVEEGRGFCHNMRPLFVERRNGTRHVANKFESLLGSLVPSPLNFCL
jgi:hypothetical protein